MRASGGNIVTSGGHFRVDGCRAVISSLPFPPTEIAFTTKPGAGIPGKVDWDYRREGFFRENEARAREGYRLF